MATVVVTGATGFLGSYLTKSLRNNGLTVIPVSRRPGPGIHQVEDYGQSPAGDILIHLAEDPDAAKVNQLGKSYLLRVTGLVKSLSRASYRRIIYASSGAVYGDQSDSPCRVDMPVFSSGVYTESKLISEQIVLDAGGAVLRLSNLIGIGMAVNNVMSDIIRQVPRKGALHLRDDKPVRDFLAMPDAASAIELMIASSFCGIVNVGSGVGTSVRTLAELVLAAAGQGGREIKSSAPSLGRSVNVLDISETKRILGWAPISTLVDQIDQILQNRAEVANDKT